MNFIRFRIQRKLTKKLICFLSLIHAISRLINFPLFRIYWRFKRNARTEVDLANGGVKANIAKRSRAGASLRGKYRNTISVFSRRIRHVERVIIFERYKAERGNVLTLFSRQLVFKISRSRALWRENSVLRVPLP